MRPGCHWHWQWRCGTNVGTLGASPTRELVLVLGNAQGTSIQVLVPSLAAQPAQGLHTQGRAMALWLVSPVSSVTSESAEDSEQCRCSTRTFSSLQLDSEAAAMSLHQRHLTLDAQLVCSSLFGT